DGQCAVGRFDDDGAFTPVGRGGQEWRAVEPAFTESAVLWGVDSAYVDGVDLFRLPRERIDAAGPDGADPEEAGPTADRVGVTDAPVFYAKTLTDTDEEWVVVSTAAEAGIDSTAPSSMRRNTASRTVRVLAAAAASGFEEWYELFAFDRRRTLGEVHSALPTAGAYAFLSVADDALLVNPYNTARRHGEILSVPTERFDALPQRREVHRPTTLAR
ncbi:glycosyl hydrolase, partial [Halomarina rubra]